MLILGKKGKIIVRNNSGVHVMINFGIISNTSNCYFFPNKDWVFRESELDGSKRSPTWFSVFTMSSEIQPPLRIDHKLKVSALDPTEEMILKMLRIIHFNNMLAERCVQLNLQNSEMNPRKYAEHFEPLNKLPKFQ